MRSTLTPFFAVLLFATCVNSFVGCVSTGTFKTMEKQAQTNDSLYRQTMGSLKTCQDANSGLVKQKNDIQTQMTTLNGLLTATQENNSLLRRQLKDLSTLSSAQAENLKRSIDNISSKDLYIQQLRAAISYRDSINFAVLFQLKGALGGYGEDVAVKSDKGTVYIDLSERLLFKSDSNSYKIDDKAKPVLRSLAKVLTDQQDVEFTVLAHTESVVRPQEVLVDNWDLSVKRATSVVRALQTDYGISPLRMTASGQSEFAGMAPTDTPEGRAANRRTRIIIQPKLDPLLRLLERKADNDMAEGK
jgi:chemotaxis protein MotB